MAAPLGGAARLWLAMLCATRAANEAGLTRNSAKPEKLRLCSFGADRLQGLGHQSRSGAYMAGTNWTSHCRELEAGPSIEPPHHGPAVYFCLRNIEGRNCSAILAQWQLKPNFNKEKSFCGYHVGATWEQSATKPTELSPCFHMQLFQAFIFASSVQSILSNSIYMMYST
ncbi:hypothetical protein BDZ91DRAFT_808269 [Kalaharituber pfeilii]|nr:hypothetical protein BDZ91DRAFT_808269 [Kalaharituber pfeilii]